MKEGLPAAKPQPVSSDLLKNALPLLSCRYDLEHLVTLVRDLKVLRLKDLAPAKTEFGVPEALPLQDAHQLFYVSLNLL